MQFIKITTGNYLIHHGYDADNKEIIEKIAVAKPVIKLVAINRIRSVSEKYILVSGAFGRELYWEYEEGFEALTKMLQEI